MWQFSNCSFKQIKFSLYKNQAVATDKFQARCIQQQYFIKRIEIWRKMFSVGLVAAGISHHQSYHHCLYLSAKAVHSAFSNENSLQHSCHKSFAQREFDVLVQEVQNRHK